MSKRNLQWSVTKLSGTGNSFLLADLTKKSVSLSTGRKKLLTQRLCDSHFGVGADGMIFLYKEKGAFRWDFYNSDGSDAEMCGNAARCVARYVKKNSVQLKTKAGEVTVTSPKKDLFEVLMPMKLTAKSVQQKQAEIGRQVYLGEFVNTGVPHFCIRTTPEAFRTLSVIASREIQLASAFQPHETNVTYWTPAGKNKVQAVTFERGVHDFTLACGTGAVAAALAYRKENGGKAAVSVRMPGGELSVRTADNEVYLSGPAIVIGEFSLEGKPWT